MSHSCFDLSLEDGVAHLRMIRPEKANSMIPAFWDELPAIVDGLSADSAARVIVLSSTGRHFSAGMDLSAFDGGLGDQPSGGTRAQLRAKILKYQESFNALERSRLPVLAAIQGGCIGGGIDLVSACDMRYCTEDAFFVIQEINIGMTADVGTLQRLPKLIPDGLMRELAYTGRRLEAAEARGCGLVNQVFPTHEALLEGVLAIARQIAQRSPLAIWGSKEMIVYARDHSVADGLNHIATWNAGMLDRAEMTEAFTANREKRPGRFPDHLPLPQKISA